MRDWNSFAARSRGRLARSGVESVQWSERDSKRPAELVNYKAGLGRMTDEVPPVSAPNCARDSFCSGPQRVKSEYREALTSGPGSIDFPRNAFEIPVAPKRVGNCETASRR